MTRQELEDFMWTMVKVVPSKQLPDFIVLPKAEIPEFTNAFQTHVKLIHIRAIEDVVAEHKYKDRIEELEKRIAYLESDR